MPRGASQRRVFVRQIGRFSVDPHRPISEGNGRFGHTNGHAAPYNELISPDWCLNFDTIVPIGVLANSTPPYTAPIAVYAAQRTQIAAPVHGPNRAQMGPSGEIARMAHMTQPTAIDRVRGRSRTGISPQPGYTSPIGRSTEFRGVSEAQNGVFGGFRGSKNST